MYPRLPADAEEHDAFGNFGRECLAGIDSLRCTRPLGHKGAHVAGEGTGYVVERWAQGDRPCCEECSCTHEDDGQCGCEYVDDRRIGSQHPYAPPRGRVTPRRCRRCGATSTGGAYCPNGCGRI